jgi:nanoRNase/pAp phosphatase (c-di-AMP/oligoRNAs hydrolase)
MIDLLKIPIVKFETIDPESFSTRILVDSQPHHSELFQSVKFDVMIDHHPKIKQWDAEYVDIRPKYGANATVMTEYLRGAGVKPSMVLATALLYGIKTDTSNFERGGIEEDVKQFRYLYKFANMNLLRKIEKSEFRVADLNFFQKALENRVVTKKGIYSHLGDVPNADICVQVADFFTRAYGLGWIFVSGTYQETVVVIVRNDGYRKDAGKLVEHAFGSLGPAGGHRGSARAEIPLSEFKYRNIKKQDRSIVAFIRKCLDF